MKRAMGQVRSLRRLLHPPDHRSLEHIALHPQLGVLRPQPLELLDVTGRQALSVLPGLPGPSDPVAQRALVDAQVPGHLGDRLPGLLDDPDRSLAELPVVPLADLWHRYPLIADASTVSGESHSAVNEVSSAKVVYDGPR